METGAPLTDEAPSVEGSLQPPSGQDQRSEKSSGGIRRLAAVGAENLRDPGRVLFLLIFASVLLRGLWLTVPERGLIFDEAFYVNAARVIDGLPATTNYADSPAGLDPNTEHPPLGKLILAASISLLGDNAVAWRLPSVIAAIVALIVLFEIARSTDRSAWLALLVVALTAFDNLTFVHGRIGTLDMLVLAPMLVGSWLAIRRRWLLAGIAVAIALLVKLTALYALLAIGLWVLFTDGPEWWRRRRIPWRDLVGPVSFVVVSLGVAIGGLALLDARFTTFASPLDHINRMVSYGANLHGPATAGFCPEADSEPWQWLFNECQIQYYRVDVTVRSGEDIVSKVARIDFRGAMNPLLVGAIPLAGLFMAWYAWRTRNALAIWAISWAAANYLPYLALAVFTNRIMYIYYALPLVPAFAVGIALLLLRGGLPPPVRWGFLALYAAGFVAYFPFRAVP